MFPATAVRSVLWKEWRQNWPLAVVILMLLLSLWAAMRLPGLQPKFIQRQDPYPCVFIAALAMLFAAIASVQAFAIEDDHQTREYLQLLPRANHAVIRGKLLFIVAGSLAVLVICWCATWWYARVGWQSVFASPSIIGAGLLGTALGLAISLAASLALRRSIPALLIAFPLNLIGLSYSFVPATTPYELATNSPSTPIVLLTLALIGLTVLLAGVDVLLLGRWLDSAPRHTAHRAASAWSWGWRPTPLRSLVWQSWRQMGRSVVVVGLLSLIAGLNGAIFLAAALGWLTFVSDQQGERFRFFGEQGVRGLRVWWARTLVTGGTMLAIVIFHFFAERLDKSYRFGGDSPATFLIRAGSPSVAVNFVLLMFLYYALGHFCSLVIPRVTYSALAMVLAIFGVLYAMVGGWNLGLSPWITVWPLTLLLLGSSAVYASQWTWDRSRLRLMACVVGVPTLIWLSGLATYRVFEVPYKYVNTAQLASPYRYLNARQLPPTPVGGQEHMLQTGEELVSCYQRMRTIMGKVEPPTRWYPLSHQISDPDISLWNTDGTPKPEFYGNLSSLTPQQLGELDGLIQEIVSIAERPDPFWTVAGNDLTRLDFEALSERALWYTLARGESSPVTFPRISLALYKLGMLNAIEQTTTGTDWRWIAHVEGGSYTPLSTLSDWLVLRPRSVEELQDIARQVEAIVTPHRFRFTAPHLAELHRYLQNRRRAAGRLSMFPWENARIDRLYQYALGSAQELNDGTFDIRAWQERRELVGELSSTTPALAKSREIAPEYYLVHWYQENQNPFWPSYLRAQIVRALATATDTTKANPAPPEPVKEEESP